MSMNLILKRASAADIGRLMSAPEGIQSFLAAGRVERKRSPEYAAARAEMIRQMAAEQKKRVYVFCEDVAASGGYFLAIAGDEIYADPSSTIGSLGST